MIENDKSDIIFLERLIKFVVMGSWGKIIGAFKIVMYRLEDRLLLI